MSAEQEYRDVLLSLEQFITRVHRSGTGLLDHDVQQALDGLLRRYHAEAQGKTGRLPYLSPKPKLVAMGLERLCEWWLGRGLADDPEMPELPGNARLTAPEVVVVLKRLQKSVKLWTEAAGRDGYLSYIAQYF